MLSAKKVKLIAFEVSKVPLDSLGKKPGDIFFLNSHGYEITKVSGDIMREDPETIFHEEFLARPWKT
ncbi:hypothetical protein [Spiribacter salinus]|uniref:hypothetical protein n=1 Tax=Spiribacter salinus TaxID=1335746 RepID=UPI001C93B2A0|nr:hypothetical protein [Spiribacter salinus]